MSTSLLDRGVRVVMLDIEGTTTPLSFVRDVLFSYAREHLEEFIHNTSHADLVHELASQFALEYLAEPEVLAPPPWRQDTRNHLLHSVAVYAEWLMLHDRKSPALKALQGHIWEIGYRNGQLRGVVFPDVPPAFKRWHEKGLTLSIYSSGSTQAQRLLFSTTDAGDLTQYLSHFFDTRVGAKRSTGSYLRIAAELAQEPSNILFISDAAAELDAANAAGWQVVLASRPDHVAPNPGRYDEIQTFDTLQ